MNWLWTSCGAALWAACELASDHGQLPSWLAIGGIAVAALIVGRYGSRALAGRWPHVR